MASRIKSYFLFALISPALCGGCAVPRYDVPYSEVGQPKVQTIVERIECELRNMVRDDRKNDPVTFHREFLLNRDYEVEVALSLEVNNTGGLSPTLSYIHPFSAATSLVLGGAGTLSESRDHNFTENLQFSVRDIFVDWKKYMEGKSGGIAHDCPPADTELAGTLGIDDFVAMAAVSSNIDNSLTLDKKGVFGGTIQFLITKSVSALGPTWTLTHFKGPGGLVGLSQVNTDKITISFADGPNAGKPISKVQKRQRNPAGHEFLQQLLTGSITSQLSTIQNSISTR